MGSLLSSVTVDGVVVVACEVVGVGLVDLGVTVFEFDFFFLGLFLFGAGCGGMNFLWSG